MVKKITTSIVLGLIFALVGCSRDSSVPEVVYVATADPGTFVTLTISLTGHTEQEFELRSCVKELKEIYPTGFKPDLVSGHTCERIRVNFGKNIIQLDIRPIDDQTYLRLDSAKKQEREFFLKMRSEILRLATLISKDQGSIR